MCKGQKATLWSQFPASNFTYVLGIELGLAGLLSKALYLLSYLTGPRIRMLESCVAIY